ncbi:hypothetical protein DCAR_0625859 [Daucus carota subsp. sativus]|uniref:protein-serine/threonine phosphatase n=1 Tax=Daucus carota subsp. sativus TaxID=79200 RepID=A0AAF0XE63_DAUCS|nr:hypothetical protein DCAR_0625831 [Daucus carota subsp. sativus]WOH06432.1 hypothetical protein DCAR_0625859 [Daucus carota subsp. sativus]
MAQNEQGIDPAVLDDIINRLLEFRQARTARQVQLSENDIRQLCAAAREIFLQQPNLLELEILHSAYLIYINLKLPYLILELHDCGEKQNMEFGGISSYLRLELPLIVCENRLHISFQDSTRRMQGS